MRQYSIAKVMGDFYGLGSQIDNLMKIQARNYDDAIDKAIKKLKLRKGDTLSIIALQGNMPQVKGFGLPSRYEVKV